MERLHTAIGFLALNALVVLMLVLTGGEANGTMTSSPASPVDAARAIFSPLPLESQSDEFTEVRVPRLQESRDPPPHFSKEGIQSLIIEHCRTLSLTDRETAFVLALCEVESGFNPEAANKKSSARGLFQFVNRTRRELARRAGVCAENPYCLELQLACLTEQLKETFPVAARKAGGRGSDVFFAWAYAYHHDGPSFKYGGYELAERRLLPRLNYYEKLVKSR